jgi:RNA polymerase sigma factor for flagellar operon FliA
MKPVVHARKQAVQSIDERNALVQANTGLVYFLAKRLHGTLADDAELDELVSAGMLGLIRAAELFEHERGLAFATFATTRIRGAMLDELRRLDRLPRSLRAKDRQLQTVRNTLRERLPAPEFDLDVEIDREIERERLHEAMEALSPDERLVLSLSFFEDKTLQEIAPHIGVTESGASRIRARALRQLRTSLEHRIARTAA